MSFVLLVNVKRLKSTSQRGVGGTKGPLAQRKCPCLVYK